MGIHSSHEQASHGYHVVRSDERIAASHPIDAKVQNHLVPAKEEFLSA